MTEAGTPLQQTGPLTPAERRAYAMGCRCFQRGDADAALSLFTRLLQTRNGFADVHYRVGVLLERKNDLSSAATQFMNAIRQDPEYLRARFNLGVVLFELGRNVEAKEQWDRVLQAAPGSQTKRRQYFW